jgi:peptide/nickel transport system substrate-binding protein
MKMFRNTWQKLPVLLIALSLLLGLAACGQPTPTEAPSVEEPSGDVEEPAPAADEPVVVEPAEEEQVLRIAVQYHFDELSPLTGGGAPSCYLSIWWASPMYFDSAGEIHPYVFNSWESNDDFTVWTFGIDPDAVFSDGSPITAEDVKGTWDLTAVPTMRHQRVSLYFSNVVGFGDVTSGAATEMSGIVAKDASTIEVTLASPDPVYYQRIASVLISPAKASQIVDSDGNEILEWWHPKNGVLTTGPFMPETMDLDNQEVVFVRNPNFWLAEPILDKVIMTSVVDPQVAITMFQNDELDAIAEILAPNLTDAVGEAFLQGPVMARSQQFWLNWSKPPLDDINVRRALIMAVDPQGVFSAAFAEGGAPGIAVENLLGCLDMDVDYTTPTYDPEAAKAALAESSYGSADNLPTIYFVGISQSSHELAAQYIAEQWRQVLGIEQVEMKASYDDYSGPDQERIQIFRDDAGARFPDAVSFLMGIIHSSSGVAQGKMGGYSNPEVDRLLEEAYVLASDDPRRNELAMEAEQVFLEDYMFIPYFHHNLARNAMPWLENWEHNLDWQVVEPWKVSVTPH